MFGVLRLRPRFWLLTSHSLSYAAAAAAAPFDRLPRTQPHPTDCSLSFPARSAGAASVWHTILPSYWRRKHPIAVFARCENVVVKHGEGSWNVAWDARPARWLHHPDSAWLLFGVSVAAPLIDPEPDSVSEVLLASGDSNTNKYRVTGVRADGRCLFRAIAHMACLRKGEIAPDETRQQELADELRARVVEELLRRRKEVEWSIEEEFDAYVKRIEQPYIWGGEPELLMCSHVLGAPISVFMKEKTTGKLTQIARYGEEYRREGEDSINVLFHGYGHYDVLEPVSCSR